MPLPILPAIVLGGPPALAATKVALYEYLPAFSSATFAAILLQSVWKRLPDWIKEDVSFNILYHRSHVSLPSSSSSQTTDIERLSCVLDKIQAWVHSSVDNFSEPPVPYEHIAFLLYWQSCSSDGVLSYSEEKTSFCRSNRPYVEINGTDSTAGTGCNNTVNYTSLLRMLDFASFAYDIDDNGDRIRDQLQSSGYSLVDTFIPTRPGFVGYYVAESKTEVLVGIRGTSSLEELLTDVCGRSVAWDPYDYHYKQQQDVRSSIEVEACRLDEIHVAEGIEVIHGHDERIWDRGFEGQQHATTAKCHEGILIAVQRMWKYIRKHIVQRKRKSITLVGHSLGGGAACILGMLLRSELPEANIRVFAFAPPPVLDQETALAASTFTTSIVNDTDLICRCSMVNLRVLRECLRDVSNDMANHGVTPTGPRSAAALFHKLQNGPPIWSSDELTQARERALEYVKNSRHATDHLFIPGVVHYLERRESSLASSPQSSCVECHVIDGTHPILCILDMNGFRMILNHSIQEYQSALTALETRVTANSSIRD